jgi:hypothetical protein
MKATTTIFLFSVSFWPIIVTPQNQIDHRLLLVPTSIFLSFVSSSTYVVYSSHPIKRKTTVAALLYFFFIFVSYTNIKELGSEVLIDPFEKVRGSIKSEVQRCSNENTLREIVFHKTYYRDYNPYIGNLSTVSDINHPWTLKPLIQIIIQNDFPKLKGIRVTEFARKVEEEPRFESFSKACIIDFDSFFQSDGL